MSISVSLEQLGEEIERFRSAPYLLTVSDDGRPHCVAVEVGWRGDELVMSTGRKTAENAIARPLVSLLWAPTQPGEYSLIVDGTATASTPEDGTAAAVSVQPTNAVLHRPAKAPDAASSSSGSEGLPVAEG